MTVKRARMKSRGEKIIRQRPAMTTPMKVPGTNPVTSMVIQKEVSTMSGMKFQMTCVQ